MRLGILKNVIISNIPTYIAYPNAIYINIRSGDIFIKSIHPNYSQPPLCFKKINIIIFFYCLMDMKIHVLMFY